MADTTYNIYLVPGSVPTVFLSKNATTSVPGAKNIGTFCHPCTEDPLGWSGNHVLIHHMQEILYKIKPDGTKGFWPDTITDLSRLEVKHESDILTEPTQPTNAAPANTALPEITGTVKVAEELTTSAGTWTGTPTPTISYQWQKSDDGVDGWDDITGATSATYLVDAGDETKFLRCVVTGTNTEGTKTVETAATEAVAA